MATEARPGWLVRSYRELKRRRVLGAAAAYVVLAGVLIQLSDAIFEALLLPPWASRLVTVLLILCFPLVVVLAWFFDVSGGGVSRTDAVAPAGQREALATREQPDLAAAFRRSHAVPVPDTSFTRRRRATEPVAGGGETRGEAGGAAPDPARVRRATLGHLRHELRTPINAIIGYSEMLLEDEEDAGLRADLGRIRVAGQRLLEQVDGLLQESRAADALADLQSFAHQVEVDLRTPVNAVVGYAEMLIESCEESGREHMLPDLQRIRDAARRLLAASGDIIAIAGMSSGGAGPADAAGAELAKGVLGKMQPRGGAIALEGVGRLLVVDDNETNRDLISRQLARQGYTIATAADGREALRLLEQGAFDLILLDVIMPVMDGVETLGRIRDQETLRDTPVIMLSSLDETDSALRCLELGASDYISKPIQPSLLEARIAAALEIRELHRREDAYRRRIQSDTELLDRLLAGALPGSLAERVRAGALDVEETWEAVALVRVRLPARLPVAGGDSVAQVKLVRELLARFDETASSHGVDAVVVRADGLVAIVRDSGGTGEACARAALLVLETATAAAAVSARFALHVGDVVIGVVGGTRPRLELWGGAVDVAEALSASAANGEVLLTPASQALLRGRFEMKPKGVLEVSGAGQMRVHVLTGTAASPDAGPSPIAATP